MSVFKALQLPVGLAPMAGITSPEMAAKACNAGILGSLGCGMMSASEIRESVEELRARAPGKPFHINLFVVDENPQCSRSDDTLSWVAEYCSKHGYEDLISELPNKLKPPFSPNFASQFETALELRPTILSFTFGLAPKLYVMRCKKEGIQVWGTATNIAEAQQWWEFGADAVILQGSEAGGHRGSFTTGPEPSATPLLELATEAGELHLGNFIVAGGIMNGYDIAKYMALGASGVQIGTLFMGATDSSIPSIVRKALEGYIDRETELTRAFSGRWARTIRNKFSRAGSQKPALPYPIQSRLTQPIRMEALKRDDPQSTFLWAGMRFPECREQSIEQIVEALTNEVNEVETS